LVEKWCFFFGAYTFTRNFIKRCV